MNRFFKWLFRVKEPKKIKLGLALGSGGAKGFSELGALKAFEENGLEFDIIAGTSIGSIIGAFYANGYTSTDIEELINKIDVSEIKTFFMLNMDTSKVFNIIDRNIGSLNIEELKKPFCAIATEIESGDETVFSSGNTAKALCASSSYPPFFKPVIIDGKRYIDGAFANSVPADKVKEMGADYVVGIDLANHEAKSGSFLSKLFPTYEGKVKEPWAKGYQNSDTMIHPDLRDFAPTDIKYAHQMFEIGYMATLEQMPKILSDIENLKTNGKQKKKHKKEKQNKETDK